MRSIVKANGDVIKQFELEALLGAERALRALVLYVCRRLAAGARVQRGRLDILADALNLELAEAERYMVRPDGVCYGHFEICKAAEVAAREKEDDERRGGKRGPKGE
jgi:hypothetical protein